MVNQCRVVEPLSQAMPLGSVWELALVECPVTMDLGWIGNDPLLLLRLYSFVFCMVSVLHSGMRLSYGGEC